MKNGVPAEFIDLATRKLAAINADSVVARVPKNLPIHLIAGSLDPVGAKGKGVGAVGEGVACLGYGFWAARADEFRCQRR